MGWDGKLGKKAKGIPLYTFRDSRGTMASGDLGAVRLEAEVRVGHGRPLKQNTAVREEPWGSRSLHCKGLGIVWAGVRSSRGQFQWFGDQV